MSRLDWDKVRRARAMARDLPALPAEPSGRLTDHAVAIEELERLRRMAERKAVKARETLRARARRDRRVRAVVDAAKHLFPKRSYWDPLTPYERAVIATEATSAVARTAARKGLA